MSKQWCDVLSVVWDRAGFGLLLIPLLSPTLKQSRRISVTSLGRGKMEGLASLTGISCFEQAFRCLHIAQCVMPGWILGPLPHGRHDIPPRNQFGVFFSCMQKRSIA